MSLNEHVVGIRLFKPDRPILFLEAGESTILFEEVFA